MHGPHDPILVLGGRLPSAAVASERRVRHIYGLLAAVVLCMLSAAAVGADNASAPPDVLAEKLRARIMAAQAAAVERILRATRAKEESFKSQRSPDRERFEKEKQRLRNEEEQSILEVLDRAQQGEFEKMMRNRRTPPPRD